MTLAFVNETSFTETSTSTSATVTPANAVGNLLVLCVSWIAASGTQTVSDTGGNTWFLATSTGVQSTLASAVFFSVTIAVAGTVTFSSTVAASVVLSCQEWSGAGGASFYTGIRNRPFDAWATNTGTSSTLASGTSQVIVLAPELVVAMGAQVGSATYSSQTGGYTPLTSHLSNVTGSVITMQSAYQIVNAVGTQSYGATSTLSTAWVDVLATFMTSTEVTRISHPGPRTPDNNFRQGGR